MSEIRLKCTFRHRIIKLAADTVRPVQNRCGIFMDNPLDSAIPPHWASRGIGCGNQGGQRNRPQGVNRDRQFAGIPAITSRSAHQAPGASHKFLAEPELTHHIVRAGGALGGKTTR